MKYTMAVRERYVVDLYYCYHVVTVFDGCGRLWVADGIWKLMFPHCMMRRKNFVKGIPLLNYPNVCTESPQHGKAFCEQHVQYLEKNFPNVPTSVRGFLRYCGVKPSNVGEELIDDTGLLSNNDVSKMDETLGKLDKDDDTFPVGNSVVESQGNAEFVNNEPDAIKAILRDCVEPTKTKCNKETGGKQRLQKWSRGHLFIVRGGGIIYKWSPLYR
ncbi:uncharacterized protein LOC124441294 isoform X2 [Xenia sp. Carnegie-2017]|uniref:uncharacterized protein LOC124441294 isoform X2 n=1 Tax=Xenia sp. Carnegie-2017 TaxID=2897299 RepID=UPI001F04CF3C|nr:uncharacterized protein LOC124441294 isoform X2 [Xenia sp. Carnegie-2017]